MTNSAATAGRLLLVGCIAWGGCCGGAPKIAARPVLDKGESAPLPPAETVAAPPPATAVEPPPPTVEPPKPRVNQQALREQNAAKLRNLAVGVQEYVSANGVYPSYGYNLSWRVELLPYLGYDKLYQQFHHEEPWDSEHNMSLVGNLPDAFRAPDDASHSSAYELLGGETAIFHSRGKSLLPKQVGDGIENTILLVQIDKPYRTRPWTAPSMVTCDETRQQLNGAAEVDPLFMAMWADGRVTAIDRSVLPTPDWVAAGTANGGESFSLAGAMTVMGGALIQSPRPTAVAQAENDLDTIATAPAQSTASSDPIPSGASDRKPDDPRLPLPDEAVQRRALEVVRELFLKRYKAAGNQRDRQAIAAEMLAMSQQLGSDAAGEFALVTTAIKIALESNDVETANKAVDRLLERFQYDAYELKVSLLRKTEKGAAPTAFDTTILEDAMAILREAVERDDYDVATDMADVALAAARRVNNKLAAAELLQTKQNLDRMSAAYDAMQKSLASVSDPASDADISEQAGRFYCFFKGDWERGLPYLARSGDPQLRGLSQCDLAAPLDFEQQIRAADGWFELAEKMRSPPAHQVRRRSLHWYETALATLPEGLSRLKAEVRIAELKAQLER